MTSTQDYETYVDDVSENKRLKSQEDTTNCITSNMTYIFVKKKTYLLMA